MLKHEQTDPPAVSPPIPLPVSSAANARVTPDELNAALKALEDRQSSTVAIGSVVDELRLDATSEQIWDQVQKQRAQKAAEAAPKPQVQAVPAAENKKIGRQVRRGMGGWIWVLFWCTGGFGLITGLPHLLHHTASQTVTISGDTTTETIPAQGKNIIILGNKDNITLTGQAQSVTVLGDKDTLRGDAPATYNSLGNNTDVRWTPAPAPEVSSKPLAKQAETKQIRPPGTP